MRFEFALFEFKNSIRQLRQARSAGESISILELALPFAGQKMLAFTR